MFYRASVCTGKRLGEWIVQTSTCSFPIFYQQSTFLFFFNHDDDGYPNQVDFVPKPSPILGMIIWICHSFVRHWQTMLLVGRSESFKLLLINIFGITVILTIVEFNYYCNKYFWYSYLQPSLISELQWAILIKQTIVEMPWYAVFMDSHLEYFSWKWSITITQLLYKWCYNYLQP